MTLINCSGFCRIYLWFFIHWRSEQGSGWISVYGSWTARQEGDPPGILRKTTWTQQEKGNKIDTRVFCKVFVKFSDAIGLKHIWKVALVLPWCSYNGGVQASITRQSYSDGYSPAHDTQRLICKGLTRAQFCTDMLSAFSCSLFQQDFISLPLQQRCWPVWHWHPEQHSRPRWWGCRWLWQ